MNCYPLITLLHMTLYPGSTYDLGEETKTL